MKKQHSRSILFALFALCMSGALLGQTANKELTKSYKISKGFTLGVDNEYGEINIVNWEKDELAVVVRIESEAKSQAKADELIKAVTIDIKEGSANVYFNTEIEKKILSQDNTIKVSYDVKTPAYLNVELVQSYGGIFIQEISGKANLEVKYGSLSATALTSQDKENWNTLELGYGEASIEKCTALSGNVKYSEFSVGESKTIKLESAYSKLSLGASGQLEIDSKYDKLSIDKLSGSLKLGSAYTNVNVGTIQKGFSELSAGMAYGNLNAGVEDGAGFNLDAAVSYGNIEVAGGNVKVTGENLSKEASGTVGTGGSAVFKASMKYGNLNIN